MAGMKKTNPETNGESSVDRTPSAQRNSRDSAADRDGTRMEVRRIWRRGRHNAFTDLARFRGSWYCVFREAGEHMRGVGRIRILRSDNGREWSSAAIIAQRGVDLRDPKLSTTPEGRLMLVAGGTRFEGDRYVGRRPRVSFSDDGRRWTPPELVLDDGDWLWRVTWHERTAYGITYRLQSKRVWTVSLVASRDARRFGEICRLGVGGKPNEATVRFRPDGSAVALVRREGGDKRGWVGTSNPPYTSWSWSTLGDRLGGPNFIVLPGGAMWAATRIIRDGDARTVLGPLTSRSFTPSIELPSGGDCSYPGLVWYRNRLWVSYYSSHEGRSSIYLGVIRLPENADYPG